MAEGLISILANASIEGLAYAGVAIGIWMSFRILAYPDLTAEGSFTTGAAVAGAMIASGQPSAVATIAAAVAGLTAGLVTGLLHTRLRVDPLLSGILTATGLYSVNLAVMSGSNVSLLGRPTLFDDLGSIVDLGDYQLLEAAVLLVTVGLVALVLGLFLKTQAGLAIRATGENEAMITAMGVDTRWTKCIGLALGNCSIALAGALVAQLSGFADIGMGIGAITTGLAAIIVGETLFARKGVMLPLFSVVAGMAIYRIVVAGSLRAGLGPNNLRLVTASLVAIVLALPLLRARMISSIKRLAITFHA